jgi:hypothetical protein
MMDLDTADRKKQGYLGTTVVKPSDVGREHLGGNIVEGDPFTFCPKTWAYVVERFAISSVMDLGSGGGYAADYFYCRGLKTVAVDGLYENVRASSYPAICHDLTRGPVITSVDLVHCQEVVEHIDESYLGSLLSSLACGRVILMTHALPGQGGYHHVNEQPESYWVECLEDKGYNLLVEDTARVRRIAEEEGAVYMQRSGLVFNRR